MSWRVLIYPSGTTIVTDETVAMHCHGYKQVLCGMSDDEIDRVRAEYAIFVRDVLNEAEQNGMTLDKWRENNVSLESDTADRL